MQNNNHIQPEVDIKRRYSKVTLSVLVYTSCEVKFKTDEVDEVTGHPTRA